MPEDKKDNVILVPEDYMDGILEHPHQVVRNECVITCNMVVADPQKKVGQSVTCSKCAEVFKVEQGGV